MPCLTPCKQQVLLSSGGAPPALRDRPLSEPRVLVRTPGGARVTGRPPICTLPVHIATPHGACTPAPQVPKDTRSPSHLLTLGPPPRQEVERDWPGLQISDTDGSSVRQALGSHEPRELGVPWRPHPPACAPPSPPPPPSLPAASTPSPTQMSSSPVTPVVPAQLLSAPATRPCGCFDVPFAPSTGPLQMPRPPFLVNPCTSQAPGCCWPGPHCNTWNVAGA